MTKLLDTVVDSHEPWLFCMPRILSLKEPNSSQQKTYGPVPYFDQGQGPIWELIGVLFLSETWGHLDHH